MPIKNQTSTRFIDEMRIISPWAYVIAVVGFVAAVVGVIAATLADKNPPPLPVIVGVGLFAGTALGCYILIIGYVNRDASRRGMSRLLWTLLAIFIPNALGIVLYFILRKPCCILCPQCGTGVELGFGFCPQCRYRLTPVCSQCQRNVHVGDKYCPYCGSDVETKANEVPAVTRTSAL